MNNKIVAREVDVPDIDSRNKVRNGVRLYEGPRVTGANLKTKHPLAAQKH